MKILVLNGSPRPKGNTAAMAGAFVDGATEKGHQATVVDVCRKKSPDVWPVNTVIKRTAAMSASVSKGTICRRCIRFWTRRR